MFPLNEIQELLSDRDLTVVSRRTGLGYNTLWRLKRGMGSNPNYETMRTLSHYFSRNA